MGAFEDAISRIRGPQIEDLFPDDEAPSSTETVRQPARELEPFHPPSGFMPYQPTYPSLLEDENASKPWDFDPVRSLEKQQTFSAQVVEPALGAALHLAPSAVRLSGALGGQLYIPIPGVGAMTGAAAVEPVAQMMEEDLGIAEPSFKRGALNTAFAGIPAVGRIADPVKQLGIRVVESGAQNVAYDWSAYALGEGEKPTPASMAGSFAFGAAFSTPFALQEAAAIKRSLANLRARRAAMPGQMLAAHNEFGGSTFDLDGDNLIGQQGYSVSIYPERSLILEQAPTPEVVQDYISTHRDLFADPRNKIGSWWDKESGKHYIDVVAVLPDRDAAIALGKQYNQKAVFDLSALEEIPTGGTGEVIEGLPPEAKRLPPPESRLFTDIRENAVKARTAMNRVAEMYRASGLSDESGEVNIGLLLGETSPVRANFPKPKKTLTESAQHIRANLARIAADDIMSTKGASFDDWSAAMIDKYGDVVQPHLKQSWKSATTTLDRRTRALVSKLPNLKAAAALVKAGRSGEDWYAPMRRELTKLLGEDTNLFLRFLAATSPRQNIEQNIQSALKLYVQYKSGARTANPDVVAHAAVLRQNAVLSGKGLSPKLVPNLPERSALAGFRSVLYPEWAEAAVKGEEFGGPKVRNFLKAMMGDSDAVVIDTWLMRYLGYKPNERGELPSMSDLEYALNADYLRAQAKRLDMTPAAFQERIWRGMKRKWTGRRTIETDTDEPYQVVVRQRHQAGLPLFDDATLATFNRHESEIAAALEREFADAGRLHASAEGLGPKAIGDFDWETGEFTRTKNKGRENQRGASRVDALLPVWAMIQVAKGVNKFGAFGASAIRRFGETVRRFLPRAWKLGQRRAFTLANGQAEPPPPPDSQGPKKAFEAGPSSRVGKVRERLTDRYGKTGQLMAEMLEEHADLVEEQARGVTPDEQVQKLADQVKVDLVKLAQGHRPRPGTAVPAEDIKAWTDLTYTLDKKLSEKLQAKNELEPQGRWSDADEADLAALSSSFVNAHVVLAGQSAEAGRALRAHQIAKKLRNRDVESFLTFARNRGLDPEEIAKVMRQHRDPLSRARAVQTLTKLTAKRLYIHARYYTMLMDPTTWINAGLGNATGVLAREAGKVPGAIIDRIFNRGNRYLYAREASPRAAGTITGIRKGWRRAYAILKEGTDAASIAAGAAPPEELFVGKGVPLEVAANLPFRALSAVDAMTVSMASTAELHGFAYVRAMKKARDKSLTGKAAEEFAQKQAAEWISAPPEWLLTHVDRMSKQISLQGPLGHFWGNVERAFRRYPAVTSFLFPFLRTKVNVVKEAAKKTPLGLAQAVRLNRAARSREAALALAKRRGIRVGDVSAMEQSGGEGTFQDSLRREAAVVAGEASAGTAAVVVALPLLLAAGFGEITGDPPKDKAESQRLGRERPFNAVRVGNVWVSQRAFGSLEPILRTLGNAKQSFDIIHRKREEEGVDVRWQRMSEAFMDSLTGLLRAGPLGDLDNLSRVWDAGDPDTMLARLGEYFKGATILGEVADKYQRYADPYVRKVEGFGDPLRRAFTPGELSPRLDPLGDPIRKRPYPVVKQVGSRPDDLLNEAAKAGVAISAPNEDTLRVPADDGSTREVQLDTLDRRVLNRALGLANRYALKKVVGDREEWLLMEPEEKRRELTYWRDTLRGDLRRAAADALAEGRRLSIKELVSILEDAR